MNTQATTPDTELEGIDVESISDEDLSDETVDEAPATERTESTDSEAPQSSKEEASASTYDLNKIPKELRPHFEEALKAKDLEWKRTFTRKTQESAARQKALEAEAANAKAQIAQYQRIAQEVMSDSSGEKIAAYRKLYGAAQAEVEEPMPKFETAEDIVNYIEAKVAKKVAASEQNVLSKAEQTLKMNEETRKWDKAVNAVCEKNPRMTKYIDEVATLASKKYRSLYTGSNQTEILELAYNEYITKIDEDVKLAKQELLNSLKAKKSASTVSPRRTVATDAARPASTKDDIIARVAQRLGQ